jgi:hypothetical protein
MKGDPSICIEILAKELDMEIKDLSSINCHEEMWDT